MEKSYLVVTHEEGDIFKIEQELAAEGGGSFIPDRSCQSLDLMLESNKASIWNLTEEEAEALRADPRVRFVQEDDEDDTWGDDGDGRSYDYFNHGHNKIHSLNDIFNYKSPAELSAASPQSFEDWIETAETITAFNFQLQTVDKFHDALHPKHKDDLTEAFGFEAVNTPRNIYTEIELNKHYNTLQADGTGVDIVVFDRPFGLHYNPEFDGPDGYRFQKVNWFKEAGYPDDHPSVLNWDEKKFYAEGRENDHGTGVACSAAGKYAGWAKGAHIYHAKPSGWFQREHGFTDGNNHSARYLSLVIEWHKRKMSPSGNKRPTILVSSNASQNYEIDKTPLRGHYRGVDWEYDGASAKQLNYLYGLKCPDDFAGHTKFGGHMQSDNDPSGELSTTSYWMKECWDAGIPVFRSATNSGHYMDLPPDTVSPIKDYYPEGTIGLDYDNWVEYEQPNGSVRRYYYHRPTVPHFDGCIRTGKLEVKALKDEYQRNTNPDTGKWYGFGEHLEDMSGWGPAVSMNAHIGNVYIDHSHFKYDLDAPDGEKIPIGVENPSVDWQNWHWTHSVHPKHPAYNRWAFYGTSAAAPNCAGIAAIYMQMNPELTPQELHAKMLEDSPRDAHTNQMNPMMMSGSSYRTYRRNAIPDVAKIIKNPYWETKALEINGKVDLHSSTYLNNSEVNSETGLLLLTQLSGMLNQSLLTVENNTMTTQNNTTTVTLRVKDENNVNVTTDDLVVSFIPSEGAVGEVVSEGNGVYSTTYFAPAVGEGTASIKATIYGQEVIDTADVFYQGDLLQEPPVLDVVQTDSATLQGNITGVKQFGVIENTPSAEHIATINATSLYGPLTFSLESGDNLNLESVDNTTAHVLLNFIPDYEAATSHSYTVRCTDTLGNFTDIMFTLNVINTDDIGPIFTNGVTHTAASIDENTKQNEVVYTAQAVDSADGGGSAVTYSLETEGGFAESLHSNFFSIDANTGEVTLEINLSYEIYPQVTCVVKATDESNNVSKQQVTFPVNNIDELKPVFSSTGLAGDIQEMTGVGTVIYTAEAVDQGDGTDGVVTYSLDSYQQSGKFTINSTTGEVLLTTPIAYADFNMAFFKVRATDSAGNFQTRTVRLDITEEVDAEPPVITSSPVATSVNENTPEGQVIYTATATENTATAVQFSLKDDSDEDVSIDAVTGEVTLNVSPNFENKPKHVFTVIATDVAGNSASKIVTLNINNLDEEAPVFEGVGSNIMIAEKTYTEDTFVIQVVATDSNDATDGVITYSIDTPHEWFDILDNGTVIIKEGSVVTPEAIAHINGQEIILTLRASDESGNFDSYYLHVGIEPAIETASFEVFGPNSLYDSAPHTEFLIDGRLTVEGFVYMAPDQNVFVTKTSGDFEDATLEIINKSFVNDEITFQEVNWQGQKALFMYDNGVNADLEDRFTFTVRYTDAAKELPVEVDFILNFSLEDTIPPEISDAVGPIVLSRGSFQNDVLWKPQANESGVTYDFEPDVASDDKPNDKDWQYIAQTEDIHGQPFRAVVEIDRASGEVTWLPQSDDLIYPTTGYSAVDLPNLVSYTVRATDEAGNRAFYEVVHETAAPSGSGWQGDVKVDVSNFDIHPILNKPVIQVAENSPQGTVIADLVAVTDTTSPQVLDPAANNITYTLAEPHLYPYMEIIGDKLVCTDTAIDFESLPNLISFGIHVATDYYSSGTELIGASSMFLEIVDINEAPIWSVANYHTFITLPFTHGGTIISDLRDYVDDPDGDTVQFDVVTEGAPPTYYLDGNGYEVKTNITSSYEGVSMAVLKVTATDASGGIAERRFYIETSNPYIDEKDITGKVPVQYGNYYGYVNHSDGQGGTISPDANSQVNHGWSIQRLAYHYYMSSYLYFHTTSYAPANTNWTTMTLTFPDGTAQNYNRTDAYYSYNTGWRWQVSNSDAYLAKAIQYEQFNVKWI